MLAVLSATATAAPLDEGVLVATQTMFGTSGKPDYLYVYRVRPTGIEQLSALQGYHLALGFSDPRTLWALGGLGSQSTVEKIVDGKVVDTITFKSADWKADDLDHVDPTLHVTVKGEVWLAYCRRHKEIGGYSACTRRGFLRVDVKPFVVASKHAFKERAPLAFPEAKPPAGYKVKLDLVDVRYDNPPTSEVMDGAVCTGPGKASVTWPDKRVDPAYHEVPRKVTWLQTVPPLARIDLKGMDPVGEKFFGEVFMLDCKELIAAAQNFGGGMWGVLRTDATPATSDGTWTVYSDGKVIGTLPGAADIQVAPR